MANSGREPTSVTLLKHFCYPSITDWPALEKECAEDWLETSIINHILSSSVYLSSFRLSWWDRNPGPVDMGQVLYHWATTPTWLISLNCGQEQLNRVTPPPWQELNVSFWYGIFQRASSVTKCFANLRVVGLQSNPAELNNKSQLILIISEIYGLVELSQQRQLPAPPRPVSPDCLLLWQQPPREGLGRPCVSHHHSAALLCRYVRNFPTILKSHHPPLFDFSATS